MGRPQTIIGAERFHFRVRDGVGWFPLAMTARRNSLASSPLKAKGLANLIMGYREVAEHSAVFFSLAPKPLGCYMVKPHGQLVLVSYTHYCASTPSLSTS